MNLFVGKTLQIKKDLQKCMDTFPYVIQSMLKYCGQVATITNIYDYNEGLFEIDIDNEQWIWSSNMFEDTQISPDKYYRDILV